MRILFANDGLGDAGGVESYFRAVIPALRRRGHEIAFLHCGPARDDNWLPESGVSTISVCRLGLNATIEQVGKWLPDVVFSHNMSRLDLEVALVERHPVFKMMHGYFGTCIGGQKMHAFPRRQPCDKKFGASCLCLYLPRHCGKANLFQMLEQYRWARSQNRLLNQYAGIIVASEHMRREYERNGAQLQKVHANSLFPSNQYDLTYEAPASFEETATILFMGRMTKLKGGDYLIRAIALAQKKTEVSLSVTLCGDGPARAGWAALAKRCGVNARFPGWVDGADRLYWLQRSSILAVPSVWPEPFGLVGLEAALHGVPAIAYKVGGIGDWLQDGVTGFLAPGDPPTDQGLADAILAALNDPKKWHEMGENARQTAKEMSLNEHVLKLEGIWQAHATAIANCSFNHQSAGI